MVSKISKVLLISVLIGLTFTQTVANCETGQEEQVANAAGTGQVPSCKKCKAGFSLTKHATEANAKICTACGTECATCEDNVAVVGTPGKCKTCKTADGWRVKDKDCEKCTDTNCKTCAAAAATCTACKTGDWYLNSNKCVTCKAPCKTCSDNNVCTSCTSKAYYLESNSCKTCPDGCSECDSGSKCTKCKDSYFIGSDNKCTRSCGDGNVGNSATGKCESCPSNCISCTKPGVCTACKTGFFASSNGQCTTCGAHCTDCYSNGKCRTCSGDDYYLDDDGTCQEYKWYHKWWWWLLLGLGLLALLGLCGYLLSRKKTPTQGGYQQWNTSYAPRAQQPTYRPPAPQPQYNSSFRESATYQRPMSPTRQAHVVVGPPVRTTYSPGRPVIAGPPVVAGPTVVSRAPVGYELTGSRRF